VMRTTRSQLRRSYRQGLDAKKNKPLCEGQRVFT
jgi:hypothetical protein